MDNNNLNISRHPLISSFNSEWLSNITIKGNTAPFELLEEVSKQLDTTSYLNIDDTLLQQPLSSYIEKDPFPIPIPEDREGYFGERHFDWWKSGLLDYLNIKNALHQNGDNLTEGDRVFDLGCATARVLRHFANQENGLDIWGAEINLRYVEFVRQYTGNKIKIIHNSIIPHLPVEDNSCKAVSAFSVFTHIDDFESSWLAEIRRILRPDGLAFITIHSDRTWKTMKKGDPIYDTLINLNDRIADYDIDENFLKQPLPKAKTVFRWDYSNVYNSSVFHSYDYINSFWGIFFDIVEIIPKGHGYQDMVILKKK